MNNLAKYRGKHNITQQELADKLGISKAAVCYLENIKLNSECALKCAEILGENVFDILGLEALTVIPKTKKEKQALIRTIKGIDL